MTANMELTVRRNLAMELFKALDLLILAVGFVITVLLFRGNNEWLTWDALSATNVSVAHLLQLLWWLVTWHLVFRLTGAYQSRRFAATRQEVVSTATSTTTAVSILMSFSLLGRSDLPASFFICLWALVTPVEIGTRLLVRTLLFSLRRHGRNLRALLIVGADERATQFASRIEQRPELGYVVLGVAAVRSDHAMQSSERVVCRLESLARFLRDNVVDEVVVCLTLPVFYDEVLTVARICREQGIMMRIHGDLLDSALRVTRIDQFAGDRLFTVTSDTAPLWAAAAKYFVDWVGSAALICIFSPVFLVAALAVKISSPGPILFTQLRLGRNKRPFKLYKFRTMEVNAEQKLAGLEKLNEAQGPVFKMRNDPRVTGIGRVLRKLSVDELPQLVNVFKGDMSLVGPRPLPIRDYSGFSEDWHLRRFSVRPGISCLWQISGRSEIGFDEWMELDMQYIDQWSFWLDVKILAKTIPAVVRGAGAY